MNIIDSWGDNKVHKTGWGRQNKFGLLNGSEGLVDLIYIFPFWGPFTMQK